MELDGIDLQILRELQGDAKMSLNRLGGIVGLSAPSVMERIRKLEENKVITGYAAIVDARQVGLDITAFIGVSINYPTRIDAFKEWVAGEPRVLECHHVTGGYTLLLKVKCRNTDGLESLISVIRSRLAADRTETLLVLSTSAERVQIPIDTERSPGSEASPRRRRPPTR